jgi:putative oxidoreductase
MIMASFMSSYSSQTYALLRIVTGLLFAHHGSQKLLDFPIEAHAGMPEYITYVAGPIELIGGLLVLVGLFTTWAAFISSGLMAVAYWMVHGLNSLFPIENQGELAVLYCFIFLLISANGSGIWSVDAARE